MTIDSPMFMCSLIIFKLQTMITLVSIVILILATGQVQAATSACPPLVNISEPLQADPWSPCPNVTDESGAGVWTFDGMDCRTTFMPGSYRGDLNGSFVQQNLQRRLIDGTPRYVVFLVGTNNADFLALSTAKVVAESLRSDYAIFVPSVRGTQNTDFITVNDTSEQLPEQYKAYTVTNAAGDLIVQLRDARQRYPRATLNAIGFDFGTLIIQRAMLLQPALLDSVILDTAMNPVNSSNTFARMVMGLERQNVALFNNCDRNNLCDDRSTPLTPIVQFLNQLRASPDFSTPCLDAVIPPSPNRTEQVTDAIFSLLSLPNVALPNWLLNESLSGPEFEFALVQAFVNSSSLNPAPNSTHVDPRAIAIAFLNQITQCPTPLDQNRTATLLSSMETILPIFNIATTAKHLLNAPTSIDGQREVTQILFSASEGFRPNVSAEELFNMSENAIQPDDAAFERYGLQTELVNQLPDFTDCTSNRAPARVTARVAFVSGRLSVEVPLEDSSAAYTFLRVNEDNGGRKTHYIHNNAGSGVIAYGYSPGCIPLLLRGFILQRAPALNRYTECRETENRKTLDWAQAGLVQALNASSGIWDGLDSDFTLPTASPTTLTPTVRPTANRTLSPTSNVTLAPTFNVTEAPTASNVTAAPTSIVTKAPTASNATAAPTTNVTSRVPTKSPTTFRTLCNAIRNAASCRAAGCAWRPNRGTCTLPDSS